MHHQLIKVGTEIEYDGDNNVDNYFLCIKLESRAADVLWTEPMCLWMRSCTDWEDDSDCTRRGLQRNMGSHTRP